MRRNRIIVLGVLLPLAATSIAVACGPFFPIQLLNRRSEAIKEAPRNSFAFEAAHLVAPPSDSLKVVESEHYWQSYEEERTAAEKVGLTQSQADRIVEIRRSVADAEAAFAHGADLPPAVRQYVAGAVEFKAGHFDKATQRFMDVLTLGNDAKPRAVWASYMLARIRVQNGDFSGALQMFEAARQQAINGADDPLNLGVASLGGEARLYLQRANAALRAASEGANAPAGVANDLVHAITLYAEEAARGSNSGLQSLREIAQGLLAPTDEVPAEATIFQNPTRMLRVAVREPLIQRLIVVYLLADDGLSPNTDKARLQIFDEALAAADVAEASGADRLASLAYSRGQYDLAARFAERGRTPMAVWVRAKLAVQKGDMATAAKLVATASKSFAADDTSLDQDARRRMAAEGGVLALSLHDYEMALRQLLSASSAETFAGRQMGGDYWGDAAHVAERVLTVDELKQFVDREAAAGQNPVHALLRDLLARRLMRGARYADALPYFTDSRTRDHARDYAVALKRAVSDWTDVSQARAYFQAAVLANDYGIEMMGTEGWPDFASNGGGYGYGSGSTPETVAEADAEEVARVKASVSPVARRFHYRFVAVGLAEKAADRLAPRSEAFAAVLCQATHWMQLTAYRQESFREYAEFAMQWERDTFVDARDDVQRLYRRYVKEGALVPWARNWPNTCQDPDFDRARFFGPRIWLETLYHRIARHLVRRG